MRYLLFSAISFFVLGCASDYRSLYAIEPDEACISTFDSFSSKTSWYHTSVDVVGKHLSGLLVIKNMPDKSRRIVFTNEAGVTFFDFGFLADGTFKVFNIIQQLDKGPVILILRKDFELMLGLPFQRGAIQTWTMENEIFHGVQEKKETAYFITSKDCASLRRLEWGSKRKRKVSIITEGGTPEAPSVIEIKHHTFDMQIKLTRFEKE
jgi:hypothetical protein